MPEFTPAPSPKMQIPHEKMRGVFSRYPFLAPLLSLVLLIAVGGGIFLIYQLRSPALDKDFEHYTFNATILDKQTDARGQTVLRVQANGGEEYTLILDGKTRITGTKIIVPDNPDDYFYTPGGSDNNAAGGIQITTTRKTEASAAALTAELPIFVVLIGDTAPENPTLNPNEIKNIYFSQQ